LTYRNDRWLRERRESGNCSVAVELARYIEWFLTSPEADADVEYHLKVPVSENIVAVVRRSVLERMTSSDWKRYFPGKNVFGMTILC